MTHPNSERPPTRSAALAQPRSMQDLFFAELSQRFAMEVPLYGGSLRVNLECNAAACDLLAAVYPGFTMSRAAIEAASGERHGAIRIGTPEEYRWVGRWFEAFGMEPHNFYDMSSVGAKSQPVVATAFRSRNRPEHRIFCSLLLSESFDAGTRARIEAVLASRRVFTDRARELVEKSERDGGLAWPDAKALIREGVDHIFKWTGSARDYALYTHLCDAGFKIAADIACFEAHHLNHLTPNTFCMDLYSAAMEFCLGELPEAGFRSRAGAALHQLLEMSDRDFLRLQFRHVSSEMAEAFERRAPSAALVPELVDRLVARFQDPSGEFALHELDHSGFKDFTEGPDAGTPVFLRQDAYKALSEPVHFKNPDGTTTDSEHTARFGEIEQRFYAATPAGRALYDRCAEAAESARDAGLVDTDHAAYQRAFARHFAAFPKTLGELLAQGLVYGVYEPTRKGLAAKGALPDTSIHELVRLGLVRVEGIRYEDFLPVSAAGIFASNLNQYGTATTAVGRPEFTRARLEGILGRSIIDGDDEYRQRQDESLQRTRQALGI